MQVYVHMSQISKYYESFQHAKLYIMIVSRLQVRKSTTDAVRPGLRLALQVLER